MAEELTQEGLRRGVDQLRRSLSSAEPEAAEALIRQVCEASAEDGETWEQAFSRLLRDGDPLAEALTIAHDAAFRSRAER